MDAFLRFCVNCEEIKQKEIKQKNLSELEKTAAEAKKGGEISPNNSKNSEAGS